MWTIRMRVPSTSMVSPSMMMVAAEAGDERASKASEESWFADPMADVIGAHR